MSTIGKIFLVLNILCFLLNAALAVANYWTGQPWAGNAGVAAFSLVAAVLVAYAFKSAA